MIEGEEEEVRALACQLAALCNLVKELLLLKELGNQSCLHWELLCCSPAQQDSETFQENFLDRCILLLLWQRGV